MKVNIGNKAEEMVDGRGLESINSGELRGPDEALEVFVGQDSGEMRLIPKNGRGGPLNLQHTASDLLAAQLVEDPEMTEFLVPSAGNVVASSNRLSRALSRNSNREDLIWYGTNPSQLMCAVDVPQGASGRVICRRDCLESVYSCRECKGRGHTDEQCDECKGRADGCQVCSVLGYDRTDKYSCGKRACFTCRGSGWRAGIVIPEAAQAEPASGVVVSLSPNTSVLKLGDRCLFSKYAGHSFVAVGGETFTTLRESEILNLIRDL